MTLLKRGILAIAAVLLASVGTANAAIIIDLDATIHAGTFNAHGVNLDAGTWYITPIGVADGGAFNAFSATGANWGACETNPTCVLGDGGGYAHNYNVMIDGGVFLRSTDTWDGLFYADPLDALANAARDIFFVLENPTLVDFYIATGGNLSDNRGGISLLLSQERGGGGTSVPEPATLTLFGAGLIGLGVVGRRRKPASM